MSGFTALNVEAEDSFEEEIDDTREIQLEEAFKLYQNALKLHSQGPEYFQEAEDAYKELLKSEVFKYPEVVSDFAHDELDDEPTTGVSQPDAASLALLPSNAAESSASSVPQLLYLAFKNRGQFVLDVARHRLSNQRGSRLELCKYYASACKASLRDFASALERDDSDLDLWKKAARVADVLSTQRIARFCLESVLAGDDDDADQAIDLSGLDEAFAAGELEEVVGLVQDDLSRLQNSDTRPKDHLLAALRKTNDPYRFLPKRANTLEYLDDRYRPLSFGVAGVELQPASPDMLSLGDALLHTIQGIQESSTTLGTATTVKVVLPDFDLTNQDMDMTSLTDDTVNENAVSKSGRNQKPIQNAKPLLENEVQVASPPTEGDAPRDQNATKSSFSKQQDIGKMDFAADGDTIEVRSTVADREENTGSRKRSSTIAGNEEPEGRTKSKRLRARESMAETAAQEEDTAEDPQYFLDQLAVFEQADQATFDVVNSLLAKLDMRIYLSTEKAKQAFWNGTDENSDEESSEQSKKDLRLLEDLRISLMTWSDDKGQAIVFGHGNQDFVEKSTGMALFLQHSKTATPKSVEPSASSNKATLISVVSLINAQATNIYDAAFYWLSSALTSSGEKKKSSRSSYLQEIWPAGFKEVVVRLAMTAEAHIYDFLRQRFTSLTRFQHDRVDDSISDLPSLFELVETIFELFLDVHTSMVTASSGLDHETRIANDDRLMRWASLANDFVQLYFGRVAQHNTTDPLILRFVWASTFHATLKDDVDKTHVVLCLEGLKAVLERSGGTPIILPNNTTMPVISITAIGQEISRLNTLDFFTSVFDSDNSDPVAVIEKLEPILESTSEAVEDDLSKSSAMTGHTTQAEQLIKFLDSGDAALKLFLWRRLLNAYTAISYTPKIVSCLLRAIETSVNELYTSRHLETESNARQISMLKWLRDIDELMVKLLVKVLSDSTAFECIDDAHLRSSMRAVTTLANLLYGFVIFEDSVRVGQSTAPQLKGAASTKLYDKSKDRFKEMLVRTWTLQYTLLKEATMQDPASYTRAPDDLAEYLSTVHNSFGLRHYCKHANKCFVKLVKSELAGLKTEQDYGADMAQVFFDLYQLRFTIGIGDINHGCPPEALDRKTAWSLVPTIMQYAQRLNVKDLLKSELKGTIEKIQQALGVVKSSPALLHNKKIISGYLKSVIIATDLYKCVRGIGDLPTRPVQGDTQIAASSGWYFLLGHLTLLKYKSVKRVNPTPTDDLDIAASFFRQDLDHNIEKWESWYRLAQVYEAKIEDDLIWNSTKLNDSRADIALLERQAIHSYIMATAMAMRFADDRLETAARIEDMFAEFATRLYASSRPPLNMEAFKTDKHMRHMSSIIDQTMSKQPYHQPIRQYALWHFAAQLFGRKLTERPRPWMTHYARAKCLWKMLRSPENQGRVSVEDVLDAIIEAIESLPKKGKSHEPILEPHFKLVSIIHKMVRRHDITYAQAQEYLQVSSYAQGAHLSVDDEDVEWVPYVLEILKKLSHADKSNWHHRITDRAAHVIYDDEPNVAGALGAKHQFTQQIFTKTMTLQVWKPENERPGRHYVYTGRYVSFFVHLLEQLNDRTNLDQLVRRIRRKTTDFLDHTKIWEEVATTYVRLLRRLGNIREGHERALFDGMNHEEFTKKSEMMEKWAHDPDTSSVYLDIMRDAIDLKRLNNSLMKGSVIDDLIGDAYACVYEEYLKQLPPEEQPKPQPAPLPQGTFINMTTDLAAGADEDAERARLNNMLRAQGDGTADGPLAVSISAPVGLGLQNSPNPFVGVSGQPIPEVHRAPAKPGRTKTVTRREIQRKAESAIVKPPPIKTPILSKRPMIEVEIPAKDSGYTGSPLDKRLVDAKHEDMDGSRASSRRGSVQDSADGEADGEDSGSDLSALEDMDEEKKQLLAELENAKDSPEDEAGEDDEGREEGSMDDQKSDAEDEEMVDAEDEIEIQDSQENAEGRGSPGDGDEQEEFHEAREENETENDGGY